MSSSAPVPPRQRRTLVWIFLGVFLGAVLTLAILLLPPVQGWLLRRIVGSQPGTAVEIGHIAVGPGGAEAADVRLRLPNLTVEARALRLAISPWQLLSRRRLAIADLQARQLAIRAEAGSEPSTPTPFAGLLQGLQAPLAWACANAQADGVITLEQAGAAPIKAGFEINGQNLDIDRPGRIGFRFTTDGDLVAGFQGRWILEGRLDFVPAPDGSIERVSIEARGTPAASPDWSLPAIVVRCSAARSPEGESYELSLRPEGASAELTLRAGYDRRSGLITGTWDAHGGSALLAGILQRSDLPVLATESSGEFSLDPRTGGASATVTGTFAGTEWERFMPELAQVGPVEGRHTARVVRQGNEWRLEAMEATATSQGSSAALTLALTRPVLLPPGAGGDPAAWGELRITKLPLGWTAPLLGVARVKDGEASGAWSLSSPDASTLRFTPAAPFESAPFTVEDASLPTLPPWRLSGEAHLDLTATTGRLRIEPAALWTEKGDRIDGVIEALADLDRFTADSRARGTARLPTWLGGAAAPVIHGEATAELREFDATVKSLRVAARDEGGTDDTFVLEWLSPFRVDYEKPEAPEFPEGPVARFSAHGLRLDWAAPLLPGLSLSGRLAGGESLLRREGTGLVVTPGQPWELRDLAVVQGGVPVLLASSFTLEPEGRVQLGADWTPGDFVGQLKLGGRLEEIFRLRDPSGPFGADGRATVTRTGEQVELRSFHFAARRGDGSALLDIETLRTLHLGLAARNKDIDKEPDSIRLRTAPIPLEWLGPLLPDGLEPTGTLEPAEFAAKLDLPNLFLTPTRPLAFNLATLRDATGPLLHDIRLEFSPTIVAMGTIASLIVENGRLLAEGREAGTAGLGFIYFTNNLTIPITASLDVTADVGLVRRQPAAAALPLPATGQARVILDHDLVGGKDPSVTFLLHDVQAPDGSGALPRLGARVTLQSRPEGEQSRAVVEFQYQTAPEWSAFTAEFGYGMNRNRAEINTTLKGAFFDVGRFLALIEACTPATAEEAAPAAPAEASASTPEADAPGGPTGAFWQTLLGRFDLDFGTVVYDAYRIENLTGEFHITEDALDLRNLSGRMFDGAWRGRLRMDYDAAAPDRPYALEGGFAIDGFEAERIVQAAYPTELGSFSGRLHFTSAVRARGANPRQLFADSASEFSFRSEGGRLRLQVPHANLASAALLVGGAVTFSPELRAMGRLITKFSDLPVEELAARGRREPGGALVLDEFSVATPQLRLSARGVVPEKPGVALAARPLELPVTLAVRDEFAVILKGMKLIERKPGPDGFFTMIRQPVLRGTLGAPDTTDLYDVLAQAAAGSSGTFGFLMKKVQQEAQKTRAAGGR